MQKGWDVTGRLKPLWDRLPGQRDELAARTGIGGTTLSAYNSGKRRIGLGNAQRVADALGCTLEEIVGPPPPTENLTLLERIVTRLEEDPTAAGGEMAPLLQRLADELQELSFRLRQAVARQGERWKSG